MQYWTTFVSGREKVDGERLILNRFPGFDFFITSIKIMYIGFVN